MCFQRLTVDEELRVAATAVAKPVVRARSPGNAKNSATSEGDAGSSWTRDSASAAVAAADVRSVAEVRPLGIANQSAHDRRCHRVF